MFIIGGKLPRSLAELRKLGIGETLLAGLAALVDGDVTEELVVRAFLEALESVAKRAGGSRQLLRALRKQFDTESEFTKLRVAVALMVAQNTVESATP